MAKLVGMDQIFNVNVRNFSMLSRGFSEKFLNFQLAPVDSLLILPMAGMRVNVTTSAVESSITVAKDMNWLEKPSDTAKLMVPGYQRNCPLVFVSSIPLWTLPRTYLMLPKL